MSHVLGVRSGWLKKRNFEHISLQRSGSCESFGTGMNTEEALWQVVYALLTHVSFTQQDW